jgi:bacterioferritin-associated ferredoxin
MIVCSCNRITEADIRKAARAGAPTPESAYAHLGCAPQCGCCLPHARDIIEDERAALLEVGSRAA